MDGSNLSATCELDIYLQKIQNLFVNEQNDLNEKLRSLKLENWDIKQELEKLKNPSALSKQNENEILKEKNSELEKKLNEANRRIKALQEKRSSDQHKMIAKVKQWESYMDAFQKLCKCKIASRLDRPVGTVSLNCTSASAMELSNRDKLNTPVSKRYPDTSMLTSTPVAVDELRLVEASAEIGSDDDTMWPASPSIVSDNNKTDASPSLFDNQQGPSELAVFKKPTLSTYDSLKKRDVSGKEKPFDRRAGNPKILESSGDLFSDNSVSLLADDEQQYQQETSKGIHRVNEAVIVIDADVKEQDTLSSTKPKVTNLEDSWLTEDICDDRSRKGPYKYVEVVRKKEDREKLNGYDCLECRKYYASDNLSESQLKEVLKNCSKHRQRSSPPPDTPEDFWDIDFPTTQECINKGYLLDENLTLPDYAKPKLHRGKSRKKIKYH